MFAWEILGIIVFFSLFWFGWFVYSAKEKEFKDKHRIQSKHLLCDALQGEGISIDEMSIDFSRWNGGIGKMYFSKDCILIQFFTFSPAKVFWGLRSKGIIIRFSDMSEVDKNLGISLNEHQVKFSKDVHLKIQEQKKASMNAP